MKLFEFPVVTTDALTGGTAMVDITTLQDMAVTATTFAVSGLGWTITMTFDGTNAAEKLLNAQKMQDYFQAIIIPYLGDRVNMKEFNTIYKVWDGLTIAQIHTETGIVESASANTALVTLALT
jgi:hypothetical protein